MVNINKLSNEKIDQLIENIIRDLESDPNITPNQALKRHQIEKILVKNGVYDNKQREELLKINCTTR